MKMIVESTFHLGMRSVFVGLKEGTNYRKYTDCGCACGWPVYHVSITNPDGYCADLSFTQNPREIEIVLSKLDQQRTIVPEKLGNMR